METPPKDSLNTELPRQLLFIRKLVADTFPSEVSVFTIKEAVLLAETALYSVDTLNERDITPFIKTYLFLHSHLYYLENNDTPTAIPLMKGDILFSDAVSLTLSISESLSMQLLETATRAFSSGFSLINSDSPSEPVVMNHIKSMLPSFMKLALQQLKPGNCREAEAAYQLGMAHMLFLELEKSDICKQTADPVIKLSYSELINPSPRHLADMIIVHCNECIRESGDASGNSFIRESAEKLIKETECLVKRLK